MSAKELEQALLKLSPKDGDLIFFDLNAIDSKEIEKLCAEVPLPEIVIFGVALRYGQSVEDAIFDMTKSELEALIAEK